MTGLNDIRLVILDFDGVIVESNEIKEKVFEEIFDRFPEHSTEVLAWHRQNISLSRYEKFKYLLGRLNRSGDTVFLNELVNEFSEKTLDRMQKTPFVKGALAFLGVYQKKLPLYLASVTPAEYLEMLVQNLGIRSFFREIYGCPPWTKESAIRDILQKENISPSDAVLIGDSYGDQRAARETGIRFIGRNSGLGFEDPQPKVIVQDLDELSILFGN